MMPSNCCNTFISEDDLTRIKKLVLTKLRSSLVQSLDPRLFLCVFRQEFVLNARECEAIKSACGRSVYEGAEKLLDSLETKGSRGYDVLCTALLNDQTQLHLLTALQETLSQFKYNFSMYREGQIKAEELRRKEMELSKQYAKCSPQHTGPCLSPAFKHQHRARSPMPAEEPRPVFIGHPAHMGGDYQDINGLYSSEQVHHDAFVQAPAYSHYQQTIPYTQYPRPVPIGTSSVQYQPYMYESVYADSAVTTHDIPCGQQGH